MHNSWRETQHLTEEQLQSISVGQRDTRHSTIELVSSDPAWAERFARLSHDIRSALGSRLVSIEHVGSTAIPGLPAKPIIDIDATVHDPADESGYRDALERLGFVLTIRESEWHQHRMFKLREPRTNLHIYAEGCSLPARDVAFRDLLRNDRQLAVTYSELKRELSSHKWSSSQHYAEGKSELIIDLLNSHGFEAGCSHLHSG
jgi:GrpB-like predicted nucleotidyltransferase (UPF0157 family)